MAHKDNRYERLDAIERLLVQRPEGWTTGELADQLTVDPSTIFRDLQMLESRGTGLVRNGWRYSLNHRRSLYTLKMTNNEILALFLAARLLSRHSDEHNPHVVRALEKLADTLRDKSPLMAQHIARAATAVSSRRSRAAYVAALEILTEAWASQQKVHLRYRNADGGLSSRTFAPYYFEPSGIGYACYVIGWDDLKQKIITLKVERIAEVELTAEAYDIPDHFDPQQLLMNAWGVIWRDEGTIEVILQFSPQVAQRLKESVWHHSQSIDDLPDGGCRFRVHVGSTLEMKPWIRQWGADVTVLEPASLREELVNEVVRMARAYGLEVA